MSETNQESIQNPNKETPDVLEQSDEQPFKVIVNRKTDEIRIQDATGKEFSLKAIVIGEDEDEDEDGDELEHLSVDEFSEALKKIDALDLTWTADTPPLIKPKNKEAEVNFGGEEFAVIQKKYPQLPREVSLVSTYALTGNESFADLVGGLESINFKAEILKQNLITPEFRSEFFFKHAIKFPYLSNFDWEVVLKLREKNVEKMPAVAYGLLSLTLREPFSTDNASKEQHITVAVNEKAVDSFIETLQSIKKELNRSMGLTKMFTDAMEEKKENDEPSDKMELQ